MKLATHFRMAYALMALAFANPVHAADGPTQLLLANGAPLDVEHVGHAAPFVGDFDGDGKKDLLVGEYYKGRLRVYRNIGTNIAPRFDSFSAFQKGDPDGCIWSSCCMGFGPQLVDFDGDGDIDILSGNWPGNVVLFAKNSDGSFAPGEFVAAGDGKPIKIDYGVYAYATDWDGDGDLDLLAGTVGAMNEGAVYVLINNGGRQEHEYGAPTKLLADGKEIIVPDGHSGPIAVDWDRDGKQDLILGCGDGSVLWLQNVGSRETPELSSPRTLVSAPAEGEERGIRARVCVTDWNEDGLLDLLIGDHGKQFDKVLTEEEEQWRRDTQQRQRVFLMKWAKTFERYRQLLGQQKPDEAESAELVETRRQLTELKKERNNYHEQELALQPGKQFHGRIWLHLGTPGATAALRVADE